MEIVIAKKTYNIFILLFHTVFYVKFCKNVKVTIFRLSLDINCYTICGEMFKYFVGNKLSSFGFGADNANTNSGAKLMAGKINCFCRLKKGGPKKYLQW